MSLLAGKPPTIIYDGECPFCSAYVRLYRLRLELGVVRMINARTLTAEQRKELASYDLDRGMIIAIDGKVEYGADAIHWLALLGTRSGLFNRLNAAIFRSATVSRLLYPLLRLGRAVALKLKGSDWIASGRDEQR